MKVRIEIDTKTFVRFWLVVIGFAFAILLLYSARTALAIVGISLFLALALNGPVSALAKRLPDRSRTLSTAISFIVVIALLASIMFIVVPPIVQQTVKFVDSAPQLLENVSRQWGGIGNLVDKYNLQPQVDSAVNSIRDNTGKFAASIGQNFISGIGSAFFIVASGIIVLVMTFLMLVEGPSWLERIWKLYRNPDSMRHHRKVVHKMHNVVSNYVTGQLAVSGIGALCAGAVVFILSLSFPGVPTNLALTTVGISFVFALIPMFGATIAGVIVSLLLAMNNLPAGIVFAIYFMIYQQIENNFISPAIQSKRIDLSPLAVLVSVTIGIYMFGIAGGIISIPVAGSIKVLIEDYLERTKVKREVQKKPLARLAKKLAGEEAV